MPGKNRDRPIDLFEYHDSHELMRPGCPTEGEAKVGSGPQTLGKPVGTPEEEKHALPILSAPCAQPPGQFRAREVLSAFIEGHEQAIGWNGPGQSRRFL